MLTYSRLMDAVAARTATIRGVRLAALLGLVLLAAPPSLAPAQGPEAGARVTVSAKKPWVDTGVDLKADEALTITAIGKWTNGGNPPYYSDADGFKGVIYDKATLKTANLVALIGKVGDRVFLVGGAYKGTSPGTGRLYLQINDDDGAYALADNDGEMVAEIRRQAAGGRTPGTEFQDSLKVGAQGPKLVVVPAGTFQMGTPEFEAGTRHLNSQPIHPVTIAKPFAIGVYEVTFEEYDRFADDTGRARPVDSDVPPGQTPRGRRPVVNVKWDDAREYAEWLSAQTGARYRLPTEAEWEYAARAGTKTTYWWGNDFDTSRANCKPNGHVPNDRWPAVVGSYPKNQFGLCDTVGNVHELVQDCWHDSYEGAPADGSAWETGNPNYRIRHGGAAQWEAMLSVPGHRDLIDRNFRSFLIGFRVARDL